MKLGSILGALSPGLSATGLFGNAAQGTGLGMLGAMSPLLALLLHMKKKKPSGAKDPNSPDDPNQINVTQNPMLRALAGGPMAQPPMVPPGSVAPPFGMGQQRPPFGRY